MRIQMKYIGVPLGGLTNIRRTVNLPEGSTIDALIQNLIDDSPGTSRDNFRSVTYMVNKKNAGVSTILHDGDEVFLLGILGGG